MDRADRPLLDQLLVLLALPRALGRLGLLLARLLGFSRRSLGIGLLEARLVALGRSLIRCPPGLLEEPAVLALLGLTGRPVALAVVATTVGIAFLLITFPTAETNTNATVRPIEATSGAV